MEKERTKQEIPKSTKCTMKIEYSGSLRSIDLEHILTGLRMIYQHELAERLGMNPRDFTNIIRIQSIEKGSIIISYIIDWAIDNANRITEGINFVSNIISISEAFAKLLEKKRNKNRDDKESKSTEIHLNNIRSALKNGISITITEDNRCIEITSTDDGDINILITKK